MTAFPENHRPWRSGLACLLLALCASPSLLAAEPDAAWNAAFERRDGWTGGDVAGTIDLGDGRVLWVYGDSWIGKIRDGAHVSGAKLINNAVAIQRVDKSDPSKPPAADALTFHWGPNNSKGEPTAWIVPTPREDKLETWYWTSGGGALVPTARGPKLIIFLFEMARRKENGGGVWNFRHLGESMAVVDNPGEPIERWKPRQLRIPASICGEVERNGLQEPGVHWGQTALVWPTLDWSRPQRGSMPERDLYIYGMRGTSPLDQHLVLARVPVDQFEDLSSWRFRGKDDSWTEKAAEAVSLAKDLVTEFSVEPVIVEGKTRFVLVQSEPLLGPRIFLRWADTPAGPWSERKEVYTVPDVEKNKAYFTYAAKGHAMLSPPGELFVTYVVNSMDFGAGFRDASIYFPKFIRIPLK